MLLRTVGLWAGVLLTDTVFDRKTIEIGLVRVEVDWVGLGVIVHSPHPPPTSYHKNMGFSYSPILMFQYPLFRSATPSWNYILIVNIFCIYFLLQIYLYSDRENSCEVSSKEASDFSKAFLRFVVLINYISWKLSINKKKKSGCERLWRQYIVNIDSWPIPNGT